MLLSLAVGCIGLNVNAVPTQDIYVDDGQTVQGKGRVDFAVVGATRPAIPGEQAKRAVTPQTEALVVQDISSQIQDKNVEFVVLMGDLVGGSTTAEWKSFSTDWSMVLSGSEMAQPGVMRVRSVPVAGVSDRAGDDRLAGFGAAFPGVGADIGYNRVASWYAFDIASGKTTWRMLVLDSDKAQLGSRWEEQVAWIPKALEGEYDNVVVFMNQPRWTLAKGQVSDPGGGPSELLELVEANTKLSVLKAVFSGGSHTNEVFLPGGKFGEVYVVAGGGGAPADTLLRWTRVGKEDLKLEAIYDLALLKEFDHWIEPKQIAEAEQEKAKGSGSWQGFDPELNASVFPVQGWWNVSVLGEEMDLAFRMVGADGKLNQIYTLHYEPKQGWSPRK